MDTPPEQQIGLAGRGLRVGIGLGIAVTLAVAALTYAVAAIPLYLLAQVSPDGLDRPGFKTAFFAALAVGGVLGLAAGIATGVWAHRGGRLPTDRTSFLDR